MKVRQVIVYGILLLALSPGLLSVGGSKGTAVVRSGKDASLKLDLRRLPLSFEANAGQISGPAEFLARGRGYALYIEPSFSSTITEPNEWKMAPVRSMASLV